MSKRIIAIDCDDVIVATAAAILRYYNKTYGTNIDLKDFYSNDLKVWAVDDDKTAVQRVEKFLATDEYQQLEPFREAIEVTQQLSKHHELHIVTGRPDFLALATKAMLARYFPDIFHSVEFTNFFGQKSRPKAQVCLDLGVDVLTDDHLHHAETVAACGIKVLLFG